MINRDRIGALLLLAFCIGYGALTFKIPLLAFQEQAAFTARTVPKALAVLGVALSLVLLVKPGADAGGGVAGFRWGPAALLCLLMIGYGLTVRPWGMIPATSLFLIAGFVVLGERRVWLVLAASIPVSAFFWALMTQVLSVHVEPWPEFLRD